MVFSGLFGDFFQRKIMSGHCSACGWDICACKEIATKSKKICLTKREIEALIYEAQGIVIDTLIGPDDLSDFYDSSEFEEIRSETKEMLKKYE